MRFPSRWLIPCAVLALGCPAHEGPIDVILVGLDDTAEVSWARAGSDAFEPCANGATNPDATVGCGPYGVGDPGDYVVRVDWDGARVEKEVTLEKDRDYRANVELTFSADEFVGD